MQGGCLDVDVRQAGGPWSGAEDVLGYARASAGLQTVHAAAGSRTVCSEAVREAARVLREGRLRSPRCSSRPVTRAASTVWTLDPKPPERVSRPCATR